MLSAAKHLHAQRQSATDTRPPADLPSEPRAWASDPSWPTLLGRSLTVAALTCRRLLVRTILLGARVPGNAEFQLGLLWGASDSERSSLSRSRRFGDDDAQVGTVRLSHLESPSAPERRPVGGVN